MAANALNKLSTEALMKVQSSIGDILKTRLDTTLRVGREVEFDARGALRTARVEKVNHTTCSVVEITPEAGKKWRVSKSGLKVKPVIRANPLPIKTMPLNVPHVPANYGGDTW